MRPKTGQSSRFKAHRTESVLDYWTSEAPGRKMLRWQIPNFASLAIYFIHIMDCRCFQLDASGFISFSVSQSLTENFDPRKAMVDNNLDGGKNFAECSFCNTILRVITQTRGYLISLIQRNHFTLHINIERNEERECLSKCVFYGDPIAIHSCFVPGLRSCNSIRAHTAKDDVFLEHYSWICRALWITSKDCKASSEKMYLGCWSKKV